MVSQPYFSPTATLWLASILLAWTPLSGCVSIVRSERLEVGVPPKSALAPDSVPLIPDGIQALCQPILHRLAQPFIPREVAERDQPTVRPPHSKFHPVPTQPVFGARVIPVEMIPVPFEPPPPAAEPEPRILQPEYDESRPGGPAPSTPPTAAPIPSPPRAFTSSSDGELS